MNGDAIAEVEVVSNLSILVMNIGISLIKSRMITIQVITFLIMFDKSVKKKILNTGDTESLYRCTYKSLRVGRRVHQSTSRTPATRA